MKYGYICVLLMFSATLSAQNAKKVITQTSTPKTEVKEQLDSFKIKVDSLLTQIDYLLQVNNEQLNQININTSLKGRYKLYPTENIYHFLELDTKTGKIKQVQWNLDEDKEFTSTINSEDLNLGYGYGSGTFELYPTKNMYQFLLIDKTNGRKWHVQWGLEDSKRWIRRIW